MALRDMVQGNWRRLAQIAATGLAASGLIVGIAIELDGVAARAVNGVGGVLWIASGAALVAALRHEENWRVLAPATLAVGLTLSYVVRPSDIVMASIGFAAGGAIIAILARRPFLSALLVPASWLPLHLFLAVSRSIYRALTGGEATVRTEPPPTAALVPFMMIVAAAAAGIVVQQLRLRRTGHQSLGAPENG